MQRVPDLTESGAAVLPCTLVSFKRRKGTIYRDWTVKLECSIPKGDLPVLPKLIRFMRQPILQARAGGIPLKGIKLEPGWEGEFTITTEVDDEEIEVCDQLPGVLVDIQIDASENVTKIVYKLRIKASPDLAAGFVEVDGAEASTTVVYAAARQPDMFTRPGDLPEPMDLPLEPGEQHVDDSADEVVVNGHAPEPEPPTAKRKPRAKRKPAMAEA